MTFAKKKLREKSYRFISSNYRRKDKKCILGIMGCEAGIELPWAMHNAVAIDTEHVDNYPDIVEFRNKLREYYGLTIVELADLQNINDFHGPIMLKEALIRYGLAGDDIDIVQSW